MSFPSYPACGGLGAWGPSRPFRGTVSHATVLWLYVAGVLAPYPPDHGRHAHQFGPMMPGFSCLNPRFHGSGKSSNASTPSCILSLPSRQAPATNIKILGHTLNHASNMVFLWVAASKAGRCGTTTISVADRYFPSRFCSGHSFRHDDDVRVPLRQAGDGRDTRLRRQHAVRLLCRHGERRLLELPVHPHLRHRW